MKVSYELMAKAKKDYENEEIEVVGDFNTYFAGYIAAIKRFGSNKCTKEPWEGSVDCMGGAFRPDEIENARAWR